MAKIFLGIALAVMLATAALGFLTQQNGTKLKNALQKTTDDLTSTKGTLSVTKKELEKTQGDLTAANGKVEEQGKEIATQKGQMDDLTKKIAEATTAMEAKTKEVEDLNAKIIAMGPNKGPKDPNQVEDPVIAALKAEVEKAKGDAAQSQALADTLIAKKKEIEDKMVSLEQYKKAREMGFVRQGTTGRILAVNGGWNFVVLSIGDKQGAVVGATMLVLRGGEPIAKARVSSVEAATSIADILPGSVRRGVTVQPGDTVVFEGRTAGATAGQPTGGAQPVLPVR